MFLIKDRVHGLSEESVTQFITGIYSKLHWIWVMSSQKHYFKNKKAYFWWSWAFLSLNEYNKDINPSATND